MIFRAEGAMISEVVAGFLACDAVFEEVPRVLRDDV